MRPWSERFPERLDQEREALRAMGATVNELGTTESGVLRWAVTLPLDRLHLPKGHPFPDPLHLTVSFPESYPFFRPLVETGPDVTLPRHQHPFGRNLCLLQRRTFYWDSDTFVADHLKDQLPRLADSVAITNLEEILATPGEQPEPFTDYYQYVPGGYALLPAEAFELPASSEGTLDVGLPGSFAGARILVLGAHAAGEQRQFALPQPLAQQYSHRRQVQFVELREPLPEGTGGGAVAWLSANSKPLVMTTVWSGTRGELKLGAVTFPEESVDGYTRAWVFIGQWREPKPRKGKLKYGSPQTFYIKGHSIAEKAMWARMPELVCLRAKTVAVVGMGAVGAPIAIELARAGVGTLRVMDFDTVEAGQVTRWPIGLPAVGAAKAAAIASFVQGNYPFTHVVPVDHRIGDVNPHGQPERDILASFLERSDLLIDATAEWGVSHFLADLAKQASLPYLRVFATRGAWGGEVAVIPANSEACWGCIYEAQQDERIARPAEAPEEQGEVQPAGCADPTFTGAHFDLQVVSLGAVRAAIELLSSDDASGLHLPKHVWIVSLRGSAGERIPPRWAAYPLERHPSCPGHHS